jgi:hypothetical protein
VAYWTRPQVFDPTRGSLERFLYGIAVNLLRAGSRSDTRRRDHEGDYAQHVRRALDEPEERLIQFVTIAEVRAVLPRLCDPTELKAFTALLDGDNLMEVALNLNGCAARPAERQAELRRLRARVVKRLQKYFGVEWRSQRKKVSG